MFSKLGVEQHVVWWFSKTIDEVIASSKGYLVRTYRGSFGSLIGERQVNPRGSFFSLTLFQGSGRSKRIIIPQGPWQVDWKAFKATIAYLSQGRSRHQTLSPEIKEDVSKRVLNQDVLALVEPLLSNIQDEFNSGMWKEGISSHVDHSGPNPKVVVESDVGAFGDWAESVVCSVGGPGDKILWADVLHLLQSLFLIETELRLFPFEPNFCGELGRIPQLISLEFHSTSYSLEVSCWENDIYEACKGWPKVLELERRQEEDVDPKDEDDPSGQPRGQRGGKSRPLAVLENVVEDQMGVGYVEINRGQRVVEGEYEGHLEKVKLGCLPLQHESEGDGSDPFHLWPLINRRSEKAIILTPETLVEINGDIGTSASLSQESAALREENSTGTKGDGSPNSRSGSFAKDDCSIQLQSCSGAELQKGDGVKGSLSSPRVEGRSATLKDIALNGRFWENEATGCCPSGYPSNERSSVLAIRSEVSRRSELEGDSPTLSQYSGDAEGCDASGSLGIEEQATCSIPCFVEGSLSIHRSQESGRGVEVAGNPPRKQGESTEEGLEVECLEQSWIFARKWPNIIQGAQLGLICGFLSLSAWMVVLSPILVLIIWGSWLIAILDRHIIGLAVIMAGIALLLAFYSIMLWWRTQWQSSRAVAILLLLAVALLCAYELCAVYVTAGSSASERYSPSGFFFGVSAIALAINMLFICRMVFNGTGLDVDEYVRRSYKFAYSDCIEVGPVACLPEPPDANELYTRQSKLEMLHAANGLLYSVTLASHLGLLYLGSLLVLLVYSILYGLTAKESHWLGAITSAAVVILDWNMGICLFGFELLKNRVVALFVAATSRVFLICFGVHYWYLGHCISYAVVASVLLGAAVSRHLSIMNPLAARRDALRSTVIRLREGFRRKGQNSSSSSSESCGSSAKRSSSVETGHLGIGIESICRSTTHCTGDTSSWNNVVLGGTASSHEGIISDKSIDSGRPSLALRSSSCRSVIQEPEVGTAFADKHFDHSSSYMVCSSGGLENQGCESSASTLANQQALDLNLALVFQERLNDPRVTSMLKRRARQGDLELVNLLQDKGLDPNFAVMLKEKGLDPTILALLQRSSLDADRDHRDNTDVMVADLNSLENPMPNQISLSEELRRQGLEKWLEFSRTVLHQVAGTPERAWVVFSFVFILETVIVAVFRPKTIKVINATHQQFEFGFSVLLLSPVVCSIMAFLQSLQAEEMAMTSRPRKYGFIAWLLSTCVGLLLSFLSKSSLLLGLALTVPLMVACLSIAVPIWIRNGYQFWVPRLECSSQGGNHQTPGTKERIVLAACISIFTGSVLALGAIVSAKPLDDLDYKGWAGDQKSFTSPYASPVYLGWVMTSAIALIVTGVLPIVSWFATYRFSLSSALCVGIFAVVLVAFCGASYLEVVNSRDDRVPTKGDFLAALLPLVCIPAVLSLCSGLHKWKDDDWKLSRGVYVFVGIGLLLLLGAISAVIVIVKPWTVGEIGVAFLLIVLLLVLAIGVIHYWASNNFYLTRTQMFFVCFLAFLLALAAFVVGLLEDEPFAGASVGYFSFLFLLAGRALTVLLSPPIVVYSPRVLPVYVYDAHADCAKNVSAAFLVLYGIALATEGWGVVASLLIYPPFAGAAVSAITLVVAFGFAVSRPCLTLKMMEDAVHFLSKETVVQAIARSATKFSIS
ncbi:hypothetical protein HHK36_017508 [Tetracentron sinense]|uniref:Calpain-type cysteine protease DEK1 n=1 Tax=Tetracentron sinense TaxID=13715 RepID=A0A834Z2M0_TETSI|nr:hypothetical protein HHK36_017508 [Tetracentron sinense]